MVRVIPPVDQLPHALYTAAQVRALDRCAIEEFGIPGHVLMQRAGETAFHLLRQIWPDAAVVTVVCGIGNNGGDGYVVARQAHETGLKVHLVQLGDPAKLKGDALEMARAYREAGGVTGSLDGIPAATDVIVDAVFGTGLEREVEGPWAQALRRMDRHPAPVLAVDIPSGLHADTGRVMGMAVRATATLSFIALKRGLFTGEAPEYAGRIYFEALEVPARVYATQILSARRIDWRQQSELLSPRSRIAHKGDFGHVLVVGGAPGMPGAARLAGEAAARAGAGLVTVATHPSHAPFLNQGRPELIVHGVETARQLNPLLRRASVVVLGPGLGEGEWALEVYRQVLDSGVPMILDADGLNLLAQDPQPRGDWVLTPHPGEAARLLGKTVNEVQRDRFAAVHEIQARYGGVALLKGAGTVIEGTGHRTPAVCSDGNPGLASGGTGDVLSGVVGALVAQGFDLHQAAEMGVSLHAAAGDRAALQGERGMLASDLFPWLRTLLNPEIQH